MTEDFYEVLRRREDVDEIPVRDLVAGMRLIGTRDTVARLIEAVLQELEPASASDDTQRNSLIDLVLGRRAQVELVGSGLFRGLTEVIRCGLFFEGDYAQIDIPVDEIVLVWTGDED